MRHIPLVTLVALLGCSVELQGLGEPDVRVTEPVDAPDVADAGSLVRDATLGDAGPCDSDASHASGVCEPEHTACSEDGGAACPCSSDLDSDADGTVDCVDGCPEDALKQMPGACGCGVRDRDTDQDALPDCLDGCPEDGHKTSPGVCGCGASDRDDDEDGVADCFDGCPKDDAKTDPGVCGCGKSDGDEDEDGIPDCRDACPGDPLKTEKGACGCGVSDEDSDEDGVVDCEDPCVGESACPCVGNECSNTPPTVAFALPTVTTLRAKQLGVVAEASDSDGTIEQVALYVDGTLLRSELNAPYQWGTASSNHARELWDLPLGPHRLELEARDDAGATTRAVLDIVIEN